MIKLNNEDVASRYLFVDLAIKNMQLDFQHVMNGQFKIKQPYISMIERLVSRGINERRQLKQVMYKNKIRIEPVGTKGMFTSYMLYVDRHESKIVYINAVIMKNVEVIMMELQEDN